MIKKGTYHASCEFDHANEGRVRHLLTQIPACIGESPPTDPKHPRGKRIDETQNITLAKISIQHT
jgi:hypothetical protein